MAHRLQNLFLCYFLSSIHGNILIVEKYALNKFPDLQSRNSQTHIGSIIIIMIQNLLSMSTWLMFFLFVEHLGRTSIGRDKHYSQCIRYSIYDNNGFCYYMRFTYKQFNWSWRSSVRTRDYKATHKNHICLCSSIINMFLFIPHK